MVGIVSIRHRRKAIGNSYKYSGNFGLPGSLQMTGTHQAQGDAWKVSWGLTAARLYYLRGIREPKFLKSREA